MNNVGFEIPVKRIIKLVPPPKAVVLMASQYIIVTKYHLKNPIVKYIFI